MILIGENVQILAKVVSEAIQSRDARPLQELAVKQAEADVHYLDLNIGPARKNPEETMGWLVDKIQEVVDTPLCLDTTNPVAMEAGLARCERRAIINSANGTAASREKMMPLARKYDAHIIISVLNDAGIPHDAASRAESILETVEYANGLGIPNPAIWVDPIMMPVAVAQPQAVEVLEFLKLLPDLLPETRSTVGLSNLSNGVPARLRPFLNRVMLVMAQRVGLTSAIVDSFDHDLIRLAGGEPRHLVDLVHRTMDGEPVDMASLSSEARDVYKTARVLLGRELFSPSWLEL